MNNYILVIKLAIAGIFSNKMRAFLTMLGIIIGVSSVISIISVGDGAQSLITGSIKRLGTNMISVLPGKSDEKGPPATAYSILVTTLKKEDADALEKLPHVQAVASYASGTGEIVYTSRSIDGNFTGTTYTYPIIENHNVATGRFFTKAEESAGISVAVLGASIKNELFPFINPIGRKIKINNQTFKVIGILEEKGASLFRNNDNQIVIPLKTAQNKLLGYDYLGMIRIKIDDEQNIDKVKPMVEKTLRFSHKIKNPENDDFSVRAISSALDTFNTITYALKFFLAAIAAVSLLVGGIGITNIMLMTVKERTKEIGLRKAIGARPEDIKRQFMIEASVLTVTGGVLGIIAGIVFSFLTAFAIGYLGYDWEFSVPLYSVLLAFVISGMIGLIFGTYPAKRAANLNPIEALRYE